MSVRFGATGIPFRTGSGIRLCRRLRCELLGRKHSLLILGTAVRVDDGKDGRAHTFSTEGDVRLRFAQKVVFTTIDVSEMYRLPRYTPKTARDHSASNRCSEAISGHRRHPSRTPKFGLRIRRLGVRIPPNAPCDVARHRTTDPMSPSGNADSRCQRFMVCWER